MTSARPLSIRAVEPGDEPEVLRLLAASMGWVPDAHHRDYFRWKHHHNPFGASPAWVAVDGHRIAGFRTFMRWELEPQGAAPPTLRAVRAVDTATHPDYQGQGVFSSLTQHALAQFEAEGVDFVFNTPNAKSRPGYLKMGWVEVGTLPVRMRPAASARSILRLVTSRTPAERWSIPTDAGTPAAETLADFDHVAALLATTARPGSNALTTRRSVEFLRWRYCEFAPLHYRCLPVGSRARDGFVVFRLRRRGNAVEAVIDDVLLPAPTRALPRLLAELLRATGADYVLRVGNHGRDGLVRLPGQGPTLTFRAVARTDPPPLDRWNLEMGDVELF